VPIRIDLSLEKTERETTIESFAG
ncbi:unnamed protein product, partial [Allacma fusca]